MGNVHLVTGYAGTQHVTSADQGSLNAILIGSGEYVLHRGNQFSADVISNNQITIHDGDLMMQGRHVRMEPGTTVDLAIENGQQGVVRHDLIVARYTKDPETTIEEVNLVVIKGTPVESDPADPGYTSGDIINDRVLLNEMPLYRVIINGLNVQSLEKLFITVDIPRTDDIETALEVAEAAQTTANTAVTNAATAQSTADTNKTNLSSHTGNTSNPHGVTKSQVGLGKVNNNAISMSLSGTTLTISYS